MEAVALVALLFFALLIYAVGRAIFGSHDRARRLAELENRVNAQDREIDVLRNSLQRLSVDQKPTAKPAEPPPVTITPPALAPSRPIITPPVSVAVPSPVAASTRVPTASPFEARPVSPPPPAPAPPPAATAFAPSENVGAHVAAERQSLEQRVGVNWLNRIGITLLVFGVAFFMAYQLTHVGPLGKVLAGIGVSAALLVGSLWLEKKPRYTVFARAGIGGGWALLFLTLYAAHYFTATRVIESEFLDLVLLFVIGVGMVLHSLRYQSQVVTGLAFLLAFSTVTMSQATVFCLLASAILALGLEVVCMRQHWYILELAGIAGAYGNHFLWLDRTLQRYGGPHHPFDQFLPSTIVLLLFYLIFRVGYVLRTPRNSEEESVSGVSALLNGLAIMLNMRYQSFHPEYAFWALMFFGVVEYCFAFWVRARQRFPAFALLCTLASAMVVGAIPLRYHNTSLVLFWLVQAQVLWLAGFFLKEKLLRAIGGCTAALSLVVLTLTHADIFAGMPIPDPTRTALLYLFAAALFWCDSEWLSNRLSLSREEMEYYTCRTVSRVASACVVMATWLLVPGLHTLYAWLLLGSALIAVGLVRKRTLFRVDGYVTLSFALVRLFVVHLQLQIPYWFGLHERVFAAAAVIAVLAGWSEVVRRSAIVSAEEKTAISGVFASAASAVLSVLLYLELAPQWIATGWSAMLLIGLAVTLYGRDGVRRRVQNLLLACMIFARVLAFHMDTAQWRRMPLWVVLALFFASVPLGFLLRRKPCQSSFYLLTHPEQPLFFLPLALLVILLGVEVSHTWLTLSWSLLGVLVFLIALAIGERSFRLAGVGLLLVGGAKLVVVDVWQLDPTARYLSLIGVGIALLGVSFLYSRYSERIKQLL